jgi:hypothetical protein
MFCSNCGQVFEAGKTFCKHCGAPAPVLSEAGSETAAGAAATEVKLPAVEAAPEADTAAGVEDTAIRLSAGPPLPPPTPVTQPPPPPNFAPAAPSLPSAAPDGYGAWVPPQGSPGRQSRAGLIWGIVAAVIIVLAGAGVGVYFGFFRDGDDTAKTTTTKVGTSSTIDGATTSGSGLTTSTGMEATTTVAGSSTTQTIPGLTTSTSGATTTSTTGAPAEEYLMATDNLVAELSYDDERIPELATEINNTAPNVPTWVRDELSTMLSSLDTLNVELAALDVPVGFEDCDHWLREAVTHMGKRIYATMQGVEKMWDTGKTSSANALFDEGRTERDAYRGAMDEYYNYLPIE